MSAETLPHDPFDLAAWLERVMRARPGAEREAQALWVLQALETPVAGEGPGGPPRAEPGSWGGLH